MKSSLYGAGAEYALHTLLILASRKGPASVNDLAAYQEIPERFLAKLFTRLGKAGLVTGVEGKAGGFILARPAEEVTFLDVLEAVDPRRRLFECAEIRRNCALYHGPPPAWATKGMCRIHAFMEDAEAALKAHLARMTLAELSGEFGCKAPPRFLEETDGWFRERMERRAGRNPRSSPAAKDDEERRRS